MVVGQEQGEGEVEVIHSWSAPRSLSTSLMYSFVQVSKFPFTVFVCVSSWLVDKKIDKDKGKEWSGWSVKLGFCALCTWSNLWVSGPYNFWVLLIFCEHIDNTFYSVCLYLSNMEELSWKDLWFHAYETYLLCLWIKTVHGLARFHKHVSLLIFFFICSSLLMY